MDETLTFAELAEMESTQGREAIDKLVESAIEKNWTDALPLQGIPIFRYRPESLSQSMGRALPDLLILALMNVMLFLAAYASFIRQEAK